jgi:hypothetical protein
MSGIFIRSMEESDVNFIFSSWLKSYRNTQKYVDSTIYFEGQHKLIEHILGNSDVYIAALDEDPDTIIGYAVVSGETLHWCYIKSTYRNLGFARIILDVAFKGEEPKFYSHFMPSVYFLCKNAKFNPYAYL